jgi:hypothetical protein
MKTRSLSKMNNMNKISLKALFILLVSCLTLGAAPQIKFVRNEIDFGKVKQRIRETRTLNFSNTGDDTLQITDIRTTCGCTAAIVSSEKIPPGKSGRIEVTFNSNTYTGKVTRLVRVHSNDPSNQIVTLTVKADVLPPTIELYFFYSEDCEDYNFVKTKVLCPLKKKYKLKIQSLEISSSRNYNLLVRLEEYCNDRGNRLPIVIIGNSILGGKDEIEKSLERKISDCFHMDCGLPELKTEKDTSKANQKKIQLVYFYDKKYIECDRTDYELKYLRNKYPELLIMEFDIKDIENKKLNEKMCDSLGVPEQMKLVTPIVFIRDTFFIKEDIISKRPEEFIKKCLSAGTMIPCE